MTGTELITYERERQITDKGYSAVRDDAQIKGELIECAINIADDVWTDATSLWEGESWPDQRANHVLQKYGDNHVLRLAIAGALIAAEIDRLQRLSS